MISKPYLNLRLILGGLALMSLTGLAGCSGQKGKKGAESEKTLTIGSWQEPDQLNPLTSQMLAAKDVQGLFYQELVGMTEKWEFFPQLVEKIPNLEDRSWKVNPDGRMQVDWTLKEGLKWQDGKPLTVEDVIFGHEMAMNPLVPVVSRERDDKIEKILKTGSNSFTVFYKAPYAYADKLPPRPMPAHLLKPLVGKLKEDPDALSDFSRVPMGNGPFMVKAWKGAQFIELVRNPHFHGKKPFFEKIIYRIYGSNALIPQSLEKREVDILATETGLNINQFLQMKKKAPEGIYLDGMDGLSWEHIDFNLDDPVLKDPQVRLGLVLATDRDRIVKELFEGELSVAHSWLPPKHYGYDKGLPLLKYSPKKAQELFKKAGYKKGKDGIYANAKGQKLSFVFMTTEGDNIRLNVQQLVQSFWKEVGVEVTIKNQNPKAFFGETVTKRQYPHLAMYAWTMSPLADGMTMWTCDNIPTEKNGWTGQNNVGVCDGELDRLENLIPRTVEEEKRVALFKEEQKRWRDLMPAIPLYFKKSFKAWDEKIKNVKPTGSETPFTWNSEEWVRE